MTMNPPNKEQLIKSGDSEIYVAEFGDPKNPAILFVHGFPDCHKTWSKQIEEFQKNYHVIALDTRGVGKSSWHGGYEGFVIEEVIKDFQLAIKAVLGENGKVHLVAHDWGSALCWRFIANPEYAKHVLSYTSMSAPDPYLTAYWVGEKVRKKNVGPLFKQLRKSWYIVVFNILPYSAIDFTFNRDFFLRGLLRFHGMERDDPYLYRDFKGDNYFQVGLYKENLKSIVSHFNEPEPPKIPDIPIHVILFENDGALTTEVCSFCCKLKPDIELSSVPLKHFGLHSHAHVLNPVIGKFIENQIKTSQPASTKLSGE